MRRRLMEGKVGRRDNGRKEGERKQRCWLRCRRFWSKRKIRRRRRMKRWRGVFEEEREKEETTGKDKRK